jgi:hypothetical protein
MTGRVAVDELTLAPWVEYIYLLQWRHNTHYNNIQQINTQH